MSLDWLAREGRGEQKPVGDPGGSRRFPDRSAAVSPFTMAFFFSYHSIFAPTGSCSEATTSFVQFCSIHTNSHRGPTSAYNDRCLSVWYMANEQSIDMRAQCNLATVVARAGGSLIWLARGALRHQAS